MMKRKKIKLYWLACRVLECFIFLLGVGSIYFAIKNMSNQPLLQTLLGSALGVMLVLWVITSLLLARALDPFLKEKILRHREAGYLLVNVTLPVSTHALLKLPLYRIFLYSQAIVRPKRYKKGSFLRELFDGLDIKAHVGLIGQALVWCFFASGIGLLMIILAASVQAVI